MLKSKVFNIKRHHQGIEYDDYCVKIVLILSILIFLSNFEPFNLVLSILVLIMTDIKNPFPFT